MFARQLAGVALHSSGYSGTGCNCSVQECNRVLMQSIHSTVWGILSSCNCTPFLVETESRQILNQLQQLLWSARRSFVASLAEMPDASSGMSALSDIEPGPAGSNFAWMKPWLNCFSSEDYCWTGRFLEAKDYIADRWILPNSHCSPSQEYGRWSVTAVSAFFEASYCILLQKW